MNFKEWLISEDAGEVTVRKGRYGPGNIPMRYPSDLFKLVPAPVANLMRKISGYAGTAMSGVFQNTLQQYGHPAQPYFTSYGGLGGKGSEDDDSYTATFEIPQSTVEEWKRDKKDVNKEVYEKATAALVLNAQKGLLDIDVRTLNLNTANVHQVTTTGKNVQFQVTFDKIGTDPRLFRIGNPVQSAAPQG